MNVYKYIPKIIFIFLVFFTQAQKNETVTVLPAEYGNALRNPLKGFTPSSVSDHPFGTLAHSYIRWNEIENNESDGIEKIISVCNQKWKNAAAKNIKVIPRVYLHWDGDKKYWPADMQTDDYTSAQFQQRLTRLIQRLGICWDNDPRVAFVELGIFGKWGEHHSPTPTLAMQKLVGDAFTKAFKNKKVSVRQNWQHFTDQPFGEYWDSWAHYDQMWGHGNSIKQLNDKTGRYKETYIGGEVAYNWGNWAIQPGTTPTQSVALKKHRDFVINSIRWLHCTQLKWIGNYDQYNPEAVQGAGEIQKAFGYRFVLNEVRFSIDDSLSVSFDVTNTGSAPFYYNWPVEVALLDSVTRKPVWKSTLKNVDIRNWMPGEGWTDPDWEYVGGWREYIPNINWNSSGTTGWTVQPKKNTVEGNFKIDSLQGTYVLSLAILDPAGNLPSARFATENYFKGGRHPVGKIDLTGKNSFPLPVGFVFDNPALDNTLYYSDEMDEIIDTTVVTLKRKPFGSEMKSFPGNPMMAWQFDFFQKLTGGTLFASDSANTIGIYGCNDNSGENIRNYTDADQYKDAAQFKWNSETGTFQKNGQWVEYSLNFEMNTGYQLYLRAKNNVESNFKLTITSMQGDTVFLKDINLTRDFENMGEGNEQTDWMLSKFPISNLWGAYIARFDWYDNIGEPGIFGEFSFVESKLDVTPPKWFFVSVGNIERGTDISVMTTEAAKVYLVPAGTAGNVQNIQEKALAVIDVAAYAQGKIPTSGLKEGNYVVYALDSSNNISEASRVITLQTPVKVNTEYKNPELSVTYNSDFKLITISSSRENNQVYIFNLLGRMVTEMKFSGTDYNLSVNDFFPGVYVVKVINDGGISVVKKFYKRQ